MELSDLTIICQLIRSQVRCYQDLLSLAKEERQILAVRNRGRLKEIMDRQALVLHEITTLERSWRRQVRQCGQYRPAAGEPDITIGTLAASAPGETAQALRQMRQELISIHQELKQINDANVTLLEKLQGQNHAQIRLYLTPRRTDGSYTRQGTMDRAGCAVCDGRA
ncbi:MAG: flagellar protein FlgN [Candidatus Omnitrophica bacterium]|nr:flagellar protein FlgN [Candidatus Omnitrophota bacterium]